MRPRALVGTLVALVATGALPAAAAAHPRPVPAPAAAGAVLHWNEITQREIVPPPPTAAVPPPASFSVMASVQLAVYNASVAIEGGYEPYGPPLQPRPGASLDAAVATAAHDVLVHYFPPPRAAALDADLAESLGAIPDGPAKAGGRAVGAEAAAALLAQRQDDGWMADVGFTMPAPGPGVWQLPAGQTPLVPWLAKLRPFTMRSDDQFRPGPPPRSTAAATSATPPRSKPSAARAAQRARRSRRRSPSSSRCTRRSSSRRPTARSRSAGN